MQSKERIRQTTRLVGQRAVADSDFPGGEGLNIAIAMLGRELVHNRDLDTIYVTLLLTNLSVQYYELISQFVLIAPTFVCGFQLCVNLLICSMRATNSGQVADVVCNARQCNWSDE